MPPTEGWIDLHCHYMPPGFTDIAEKKLGAEVSLRSDGKEDVLTRPGQPSRTFRSGELARMGTLDDRIEAMDARGTAVQVVSVGGTFAFYDQPPEVAGYLSAVLNDGMLDAAAAYPERIMVMVTVPLQDAATSIRELERVRSNPAAKAVRMGSSIGSIELDDPSLWPFYEAAEGLDMPIFIHPQMFEVAGGDRMGKYFLSNLVGYPATTTLAAAKLVFSGVLERFPSLRFCLAHSGGYLAAAVGRLVRGFDTHSECSELISDAPDKLVRRFYVDSIAHSVAGLKHAMDVFGENRVVCGTDYPFTIGDPDPREVVDALPVGQEVRDAIYRRNALEFLGLTAADDGAQPALTGPPS